MSESVSGVDAILRRLRERSFQGGLSAPAVPLAVAEAAVHATVREIEAWLREEFQRFSEDSMATDEDLARRDGLLDAADEVARRFGGTT